MSLQNIHLDLYPINLNVYLQKHLIFVAQREFNVFVLKTIRQHAQVTPRNLRNACIDSQIPTQSLVNKSSANQLTDLLLRLTRYRWQMTRKLNFVDSKSICEVRRMPAYQWPHE